MPVLKNQRHELFAQLVAKGMSATAAYKKAGYAEDGANKLSPRLMANEGIKARIAELKGKTAERTGITLTRLMADLEHIQQRALSGKRPQLAVAQQTTVAMAKLAGLWIEKRETTNRHVNPEHLSDAELAAIISSGDAEEEGDQGVLH